jgi:hypothetical protein
MLTWKVKIDLFPSPNDPSPSPSPKGRGAPNGTKFAVILSVMSKGKRTCHSL